MRLGDRGHFLVSGEIFDQDGIHNFEDRNWYQSWGTITTGGVTRAFPNTVSSTASFDGIIFAPGTAINGLAFDRSGNLAPFVLGTPSQGAIGVPGSRHSIADGGSGEDLASEVFTLYPDVKRNSIFAYADYELADGFEVFAQYIRGQNKTFRYNTPRGSLQGTPTAITIFQDNAFLPASLRQTMIANNIASFNLRRFGSIEDIGQMWLKDNNVMNSATGGFSWDIDSGSLFDGWKVDAYYQYGHNKRTWKQLGLRVDRIFAAVDAVVDPDSGEIVCRSTLFSDVFAGCVPLNLFGRGNASEAAVDWVVGSEPGQEITSPLFFADSGYELGESHSFTTEEAKVNRTRIRQHVAELTFSGDIVEGWAGPISAAFGASWRKESIRQIVEDVTNPASDHSSFRPVRCSNPAIGLRGVSPPDCANTVGVQFSKVSNIRGSIEVPELFAETLIPLLSEAGPIRSANLHGAVRWADYSGSGSIWAYKGGLDVDIAEVLRLRGTYSRDVRAANLSERFDKTGGAATIIDPRYPGDGNITVTIFSGGNPNVLPEKADTFTAGAVVRPPFIPGLSVSVDWYKVDINNAIGQLGVQAVANECELGAQDLCALVTRDVVTDRIILIGNVFVNVAVASVEGVDLEVSYNRGLTLFGGAPESIGARLFASWLIENTQNLGSRTIDRAGQTGIQQSDGVAYALPDFKATGNITYDWEGFSLFLQGRYIGSGTNENVPLPTAAPFEDNHVDSAFYADMSLSYTFDLGGRSSIEVFGNVTNLFDEDPPVTPYYSAFLGYAQQYNPSLFDVLGRRYTAGVRFRM
jgi:outer membrane receptor protein involved in Fe transport